MASKPSTSANTEYVYVKINHEQKRDEICDKFFSLYGNAVDTKTPKYDLNRQPLFKDGNPVYSFYVESFIIDDEIREISEIHKITISQSTMAFYKKATSNVYKLTIYFNHSFREDIKALFDGKEFKGITMTVDTKFNRNIICNIKGNTPELLKSRIKEIVKYVKNTLSGEIISETKPAAKPKPASATAPKPTAVIEEKAKAPAQVVVEKATPSVVLKEKAKTFVSKVKPVASVVPEVKLDVPVLPVISEVIEETNDVSSQFTTVSVVTNDVPVVTNDVPVVTNDVPVVAIEVPEAPLNYEEIFEKIKVSKQKIASGEEDIKNKNKEIARLKNYITNIDSEDNELLSIINDKINTIQKTLTQTNDSIDTTKSEYFKLSFEFSNIVKKINNMNEELEDNTLSWGDDE